MSSAMRPGPAGPTTTGHLRVARSILLSILATLALSAGLERPAGADPATRARRHYQQGVSFFQKGRIREALEAFKTGYALSARPEFLLNLAQCHRALGQPKEAISYLETFLRQAPKHPLRRAVEQTLAELKQATRSPEARTDRSTTPRTVEPQPDRATPSSAPARATPAAVAPPTSRPLAPLVAPPTPSPLSHAPVGPAPPRRRSTAWKWLVGFGGAALVVGAAVTAVYLGTRSEQPASLGTLHLPRP